MTDRSKELLQELQLAKEAEKEMSKKLVSY
jgi:hypothetical protein